MFSPAFLVEYVQDHAKMLADIVMILTDSVSICFSKRSAETFNITKRFKLKNYSKKTNKKILVIGAD